MTARRPPRAMLCGILCSAAFSLVLGLGAFGASGVEVGLGGRVVSGRMTPLRLAPTGVPSDATHIRVVQAIGNAWRGESAVSTTLPLPPSGAGDVHVSFPLYDGAIPLRLEFLSSVGRVLADREVDVRALREEMPFAVGVGSFLPDFDGLTVRLAPGDLPRDPAGYDAAATLWIGRAPEGLDADRWDALAQWVVAGGSLVVFAGADFYLLDTPRLRELLPIRDPRLAFDRDGRRVLAGELRDGGTILREDAGVPCVIAGRFGVGTVVLVTHDAMSLTRDEQDDLRSLVPPALVLPLADLASGLLDAQPLVHPSPWLAALLLTLAIALVPMLATRRTKRISIALRLGVGFGGLAILALGITAPSRVGSEICRTDLALHFSTSRSSLGATAACTAVATTSRRPVEERVAVGASPVEVLPDRYVSGSRDLAYTEGAAQLTLRSGERRLLLTRTLHAARIQARLQGDEGLRIASRLPDRIAWALLVVDGEVYPLPGVEPRETTVYLGGSVALSAARLGSPGDSLDRLVGPLSEVLSLDRGAWLIAGQVSEPSQGMRTVTIYVVEVTRG